MVAIPGTGTPNQVAQGLRRNPDSPVIPNWFYFDWF